MSTNEESLRYRIVECITQQLGEFEVLKSMYPNQDELVLSESNILEDMQNFLHNKSEFTPNHLDFVVNLHIDELKLEVCINLPSFYPSEEKPEIYVRCNQLNRYKETILNTELSNQIKSYTLNEVCLYTAISWLQENVLIVVNKDDDTNPLKSDKEAAIVEDKFVRYWIYSHHIYSKKKREEIWKLAKELNLTGFCLPGKPGIICIEGTYSDCEKWWKHVKSMAWQKIILRKTEIYERAEQEQQQKFYKFNEINFPTPTTRLKKHSDMSGFAKFMEKHGLSQSFNEFFGLCNDI